MEFAIDRDALLSALGHAHRIVLKGDTIPILSTVAIAADLAGLSIRASNTELVAETRARADVERVGEAAVPLGPLMELLKKLPPGTAIRANLKEPGAPILIGYRRSRVSVPTLSAADYPVLADSDVRFEGRVPARGLSQLLSTPLHVVEPDGQASFSKGVCLHIDPVDETLVGVAAVDRRLTRRTIKAPERATAMPPVIVPAKACGELIKLADGAGDDDVILSIGQRLLTARVGGTRIISRLIEGQFPDYQRVIPGRDEPTLTCVGPELEGALSRALILADDKDRIVSCAVADGSLTITAQGSKGGEIVEQVDVDDGDGIRFRINARSALEALTALSADVVTITSAAPGAPVLFGSPSNNGVLCLVSPMRG